MKSQSLDISDLSNRDGSELGNKCKKARDWLATHYGDPYSIGQRLAVDAPNKYSSRRHAGGYSSAQDAVHISHAIECNQCSAWISAVVGDKVLDRQRRLAQYCCPQLFGAVEEPKPKALPIKLRYYAPERWEGSFAWVLSLTDDKFERHTLVVNYCPFCGELIKTPERPQTID